MDSTNGKWRKSLYFHYTVKIQQPHTMTEPKKRVGEGKRSGEVGSTPPFPFSLSLSLSQNLPVRLAFPFSSKAF